MKMTLLPGFRTLFGHPALSYEEMLRDIPSSFVIGLCSVFNAELYDSSPDIDTQNRLKEVLGKQLNKMHLGILGVAIKHCYHLPGERYQGNIFGRRDLMEMVARECRRNNNNRMFAYSPDDHFRFLLAYLLVVDEVNARDDRDRLPLAQLGNDPIYDLKILWVSSLR